MYEYVEHVLANYLSVEIGYSEEEAVSILRTHIARSSDLADGFRLDLENALADERFSWREALVRNGVITLESETEARAYARALLWESLFGA